MKTITFYSYKGGVGRSLTLANIVLRLSELNKKVCLIDFDLEAPGLPIKFSKFIKGPLENGLVDYIHEYSNNGILPKSILPYCTKFSINRNSNLTLIPAGNIDSNTYWKKLSSIDWYSLVYENRNSVSFFLDFKEKIRREINPDFLLIDSRTGISEMSGITISLLADDVVVISANNDENLQGSKKIIDSLSNPENSILGKTPKITFILSRIPFTDLPEDRAKEQLLVSKVQSQISLSLNQDFFVIHSDRELEVSEQLKIGSEFDGTSIQITRDYLRLFERLTKDVLTQQEVDRFENIKKSEKLVAQAFQERTFEKKIQLLDQALEHNNENFEAYFYKANLNAAIQKYDDAIRNYSRIIEINESTGPFISKFIGDLYLSKGDIENAIKTYKKYLPSADGYIGLGDVYTKINDYQRAIQEYSNAINHHNESSQAYNKRARIYKILGRNDEALNDAFKALELDPNLAANYLTLAEIYAQLEKHNEFYLSLENALKIDSRSVQAFLPNDSIYRRFMNEERFVKLLDKYSISMNNL